MKSGGNNTGCRRTSVASCLAIVAFGWQVASAQTLSAPQVKQLIVETIYMYEVRDYFPPVSFTIDQRPEQIKGGTAEATLVQRVQAMMRGDYEAFLRTWTQDAQRVMGDRDRVARRSPTFWTDSWKNLKGGTATLASRVEYGKFVFIRYRIDIPGAKGPLESSVAFTRVGDEWLGTHELIRDPVFNNWESGKTRVQTAAEISIIK